MTTTSWSVCIATLNRAEALQRCIRHVLEQTVTPVQVVIVDASDDWQDCRQKITALLAHRPDVRLDYLHSSVRSSATQRNEGIKISIGDVIFIIDDDSFMYSDCAERVLALYDADTEGALAAARVSLALKPPPLAEDKNTTDEKLNIRRKSSGQRMAMSTFGRLVLSNPIGRWFHRRVLMQSMEETFLRYDGPRQYPLPPALSALGALSVSFMPGCAMTVRRDIALAEPFDTALRYYAAYEDVDVSYRYARHGHVVWAQNAQLHHFEASSGRIDRRKVIAFQLLNMVVYLRRNAARPEEWIAPYRLLMHRRLLGEFLKDLLSRRFRFPQMRGVLLARRHWRQLWDVPVETLDRHYPELQRRILEEAL